MGLMQMSTPDVMSAPAAMTAAEMMTRMDRILQLMERLFERTPASEASRRQP